MPGALSGVRVVDFSRMYAGPFCSMILRELGAEVIKIEFRESGDACRTIPPITEGGEGYVFSILNRGKKSITLEAEEMKKAGNCTGTDRQGGRTAGEFHAGRDGQAGIGLR